MSRIENGKTDITVGVLSKIATALNVPIEYLLLDFIPEDRSEFDVLCSNSLPQEDTTIQKE